MEVSGLHTLNSACVRRPRGKRIRSDGRSSRGQEPRALAACHPALVPCRRPDMSPSLLVLALCFSSVASLKVCSFNVRSFGMNKVKKPDVLDVIVKCIKRCDIMLMMEIKDAKGQALPQLMSHLNSGSGKKNEFEFVASERLGRKSYKEQYAFIYRQRLVSVKAVYQYPDAQSGDEDAFSREPFVVWFSCPKTAVKEFVFIAIHTAPGLAVREIDELYDVQQDIREQWTSQNFVFMGDFNAACGYVPKKQWKNIRLRSNDSFVWLIDDRTDTTVKNSTECAYDRVVLHGDEIIEAVNQSSVEVFDFKTACNLTEEQALAVSDHFPIGFSISTASQRCPPKELNRSAIVHSEKRGRRVRPSSQKKQPRLPH